MQAVGRRLDSAQLHHFWEPVNQVAGYADEMALRELESSEGFLIRGDHDLRYFMVKLLRVDGGCLGAEKR